MHDRFIYENVSPQDARAPLVLRLKTARSALELFVIPPMEFAENLVKLN
jgi:hypothetical protein